MTDLIFTIDPYVGALPIKFGMTPDEVEAAIGPAGRKSGNSSMQEFVEKRSEIGIRVTYSKDGGVVEIGFLPHAKLFFEGKSLFEERDPVGILKNIDNQPLESHGFLVFMNLGITETGFHDRDPGQRAFTVFKKGRWNELA